MDRKGENKRSKVDEERSEQHDSQGIEHVKGLLNSLFYGSTPPEKVDINDTKEDENDNLYADQVMAALRIDDHIPTDPKMIRQTKLFQSAYKTIQWQRDNYLVGTEYANWRKSERERERPLLHRNIRVSDIPYDPTALGPIHFSKLAVDFLPSETMHQAVSSLIVGLPIGPIYPMALTTVLPLIPMQQARLDHIIKSSILTYLDNPANRVAIKNTTQGFIYRRSGGMPLKNAEPSSKTPG